MFLSLTKQDLLKHIFLKIIIKQILLSWIGLCIAWWISLMVLMAPLCWGVRIRGTGATSSSSSSSSSSCKHSICTELRQPMEGRLLLFLLILLLLQTQYLYRITPANGEASYQDKGYAGHLVLLQTKFVQNYAGQYGGQEEFQKPIGAQGFIFLANSRLRQIYASQ